VSAGPKECIMPALDVDGFDGGVGGCEGCVGGGCVLGDGGVELENDEGGTGGSGEGGEGRGGWVRGVAVCSYDGRVRAGEESVVSWRPIPLLAPVMR
jgi:hypothetical protein